MLLQGPHGDHLGHCARGAKEQWAFAGTEPQTPVALGTTLQTRLWCAAASVIRRAALSTIYLIAERVDTHWAAAAWAHDTRRRNSHMGPHALVPRPQVWHSWFHSYKQPQSSSVKTEMTECATRPSAHWAALGRARGAAGRAAARPGGPAPLCAASACTRTPWGEEGATGGVGVTKGDACRLWLCCACMHAHTLRGRGARARS